MIKIRTRPGRRRKNNAEHKKVKDRMAAPLAIVGKITLIAAIVVSLAIAIEFVYETAIKCGYFQIKRIEITGNRIVSQTEIEKALGDVLGNNIFEFDIRQAGKRLEYLPWVSSVKLHRQLPSSLLVDVTERTPLATVRARKLWLVDEYGYLLEDFGNVGQNPFPVIYGINTGAMEWKPGARIDAREIGGGILAIQRLSGYMLFGQSALAEVDMSKDSHVELRFAGSNVSVFAPRRGWTDEAERLRTVDYIIRGKEGFVESIDLTFSDKVIVKYKTTISDDKGRSHG